MTANNKRNITKTTVLAISTILLFGTFAATPVFAKACKNVHLEVKNTSNKPIEIVDIDYWDSESEKWRSEPVPNEIIHKNRTWQESRNLERVNGQPVKIRVEYKRTKWKKWSKKWVGKGRKIKFISESKQCTRNTEYVMHVR